MEQYFVFLFAVIFLLILTYAGLRKSPINNSAQFFLLRVVCALSAAGFVTFVPGFINLELSHLNFSISAGGGLAVFVIIYYLNPPMVINEKLRFYEHGECATDLNLRVITSLKEKDYKKAEEYALQYIKEYPNSLRAKYNLAISIAKQSDDRLEEAYKLLKNEVISTELFKLLFHGEGISDPITFVLNDQDLVQLFAKFPALKLSIEAYRSQFNPIMGTKDYSQGGCFPKGSLVMLPYNSSIEIEKLNVGDKILARNSRCLNVMNEVTSIGARKSNTVLINNIIRVSVTQPLKKSDETWCEAAKLFIGDELIRYNEAPLIINSLLLENNIIDVYWIEVFPDHCYWVEGVLAHNKILQ